jgi:hypothetical protein
MNLANVNGKGKRPTAQKKYPQINPRLGLRREAERHAAFAA